jgi:hypothetical protein
MAVLLQRAVAEFPALVLLNGYGSLSSHSYSKTCWGCLIKYHHTEGRRPEQVAPRKLILQPQNWEPTSRVSCTQEVSSDNGKTKLKSQQESF